MLPGKTYTPEEILRIALRRKWWIVVPLVLGTTAAIVYGKSVPNQYRSETVIMLMPQRVPDSYVKTNDDYGLEARVNSLFQQILSTSRLERIILDSNLYAAERQALSMEEVVNRMRYADLHVNINGRDTFRVSYVGTNAETVRKVAERVASLFIEKDVRDRENVTEDTNEFLQSELDDAKLRLAEQEKKVEEFRRRYSRQLQAAPNVQVIQSTDAQRHVLNESINRDQERRLLLERQLADLESPSRVATAPSTDSAVIEATPEQRLDAAEAQLRAYQLRLKPDHPDIRTLERTVRDLRAAVEAEERRAVSPVPTEERPLNRAEATRQRQNRDLRAQIEDVDRQLRSKREQDERLRQIAAEYQGNLEAVPTREAELIELNRDATALQTTYSSLLNKRQESRLAANLERRSLGDQFMILEPASESKRPIGPNRQKIYAGGLAGSLVLGLFLVGILEYLDASFRSEADVERALKLPALASVPRVFPQSRRGFGRSG